MKPKFVFLTKGEVLEQLSGRLREACVLPLRRFRVKDFMSEPEGVCAAIHGHFRDDLLIVRSSSRDEDTSQKSNAGRFKSFLNVPRRKDALRRHISAVIESYDTDDGDNEVLVQPMLRDIRLSGVAFTSDIDTLAPYYIINYEEGERSDSVTSGRSANVKTFICFKESLQYVEDRDLLNICRACAELERLTGNSRLDIEFAMDTKGRLYIFQCRPLVVKNKGTAPNVDLKGPLQDLHVKIEKLSKLHPNLLGDRTMFGVMPDWNPAEIIGLRPKQCSLSLYKELVTDNIWAYQRDNYGYRNLRSHPLLISIVGIPFIDVRVDFNSFVPKGLDESIARKLVNYYINKLDSVPALHDKVEFEIVHSCYYLNLPERLKELRGHGFNENEIKRIEFSLLNITNDIIDPENGLYKKDLQKIDLLRDQYNKVAVSDTGAVEKVYWLIEDCKRFGTLPFAGVARAAFIAVQFLKSFVDLGIISPPEYGAFMGSLNTVTKKLNQALWKLSRGELSKEEFLSEYGHLRPNTYDILSMRYDENFDHYFQNTGIDCHEPSFFEFTAAQMEKIDLSLVENGLRTDSRRLVQFMKEAIEGREYAKFVFTKSLSEVLRLLAEFGREKGISREEMAYLDIMTVLREYSAFGPEDTTEDIRANIDRNARLYEYTKAVKLPPLIRAPRDIFAFFLENEDGNFITLKKVEARVVTECDFRKTRLENKIVLVKSADPGYDYLFTKRIAGLVTQFGGANSHMAIRCAELGIPAVIGVGEKKFTEWSRALSLGIDCGNKQVTVIT